jgi:hypothetical protein
MGKGRGIVVSLLSCWVAWTLVGSAAALAGDLRTEFADPPLRLKSRPLWFWNGPLSRAGIEAQMRECRDRCGFYGFGILPSQGMTPLYTTPEFLDRYEDALNQAARLGLKMCLYDEYWFPSGSAGGQLAAKYPGDTAKRLDLHEDRILGPAPFAKTVPQGTLLSAVAMNVATKQRIDLRPNIAAGKLAWNAPAGTWQVMLFVCVRDGWDHVDYLNPDSVRRFIELTYQRFYDRFPRHFGTTIDSAFYDEPTFWAVQGGRMWTEGFNRKFQAKHGYDPMLYYPALWHDIGPDTEAARCALFGFRAELFATGFPKTINQWCTAHRIELTGHVDQEEVVNPVGLCGDLIKAFQYQDIPGVDQIFQFGRASAAYKLVSSAAVNYDRRLVMTETYGAMEKLRPADLYREAMDQYAKGINLFVPHAVWYKTDATVFPPELSYRHPAWGPQLPELNRYVGRLNAILQDGGHVAEVAVIYPIATLQAGYRFGVGEPYKGGVIPEEADYQQVGELLSLNLRRDFTYLHPEVLAEKCTVRDNRIDLPNKLHPQSYRLVVLPGSKTVDCATLARLQTFVAQGGKLIATTRLPHKSAQLGRDREVCDAVQALFGVDPGQSIDADIAREHPGGGLALFLRQPDEQHLGRALARALPDPDVAWESRPKVSGGNLTYLHKRRNGKSLYFFANSSDTPVDVHVRLRGASPLERWDPHTGRIEPIADVPVAQTAGHAWTRVRVQLPPVHSVFLLEKP